jgi:hypothetical protein
MEFKIGGETGDVIGEILKTIITNGEEKEEEERFFPTDVWVLYI